MNIIELKEFKEPIIIKKDDYLKVKEMPYKDKVAFMKSLFEQVGCLNPQVIINVSLLLKRNKNLSKELFDREDIFYNSYIELLDMKQDLRVELANIRKIIITLYYSCVKSISILNMEENNNIYNLYYLLLHLLSMEDISVISQRVNEDIPASEILFVSNAKEILSQILANSEFCNEEV